LTSSKEGHNYQKTSNQLEEMKFIKRAFYLLLVLFFTTTPGAGLAQWANPDLIVTPEIIKENLSKPTWIIIDCRSLESYRKGHIPNSISLGQSCENALKDPISIVLSPEKLETIFGAAGIDKDKHVVVYSDTRNITSAAYAFWTLEYIGHKKVFFLDGGVKAWKADGNKLVKNETKRVSQKYKAQMVHPRITKTQEMLQIATGKKKDVQVIDARSEEEYTGKHIYARRSGHIPETTRNIPHFYMFHFTTGKLKPPEFMQNLFKNLDKNQRTIAYCHVGSRAALTYLALRLMGFKDPANYDESWIVWGNDRNYPVVSE